MDIDLWTLFIELFDDVEWRWMQLKTEKQRKKKKWKIENWRLFPGKTFDHIKNTVLRGKNKMKIIFRAFAFSWDLVERMRTWVFMILASIVYGISLKEQRRTTITTTNHERFSLCHHTISMWSASFVISLCENIKQFGTYVVMACQFVIMAACIANGNFSQAQNIESSKPNDELLWQHFAFTQQSKNVSSVFCTNILVRVCTVYVYAVGMKIHYQFS